MKLFCLLARWHGALALVLVALILPLTGVEGHDANVEYSLREPQPVDRHPESNERIEFKPKQVQTESDFDSEPQENKIRRQVQPVRKTKNTDTAFEELERMHRDTVRVGNTPQIVHNQFPYVQSGGSGFPSYNPPSFTQAYTSSSTTSSSPLSGGSQDKHTQMQST